MKHISSPFFTLFLSLILFSFCLQPNGATKKNTSTKKTETLTNEQYLEEFDKTVFSWSKTIAETLNLLKTRHYLKVDIENQLIGALNALARLDPHTQVLAPTAYKEILQSTRGEFYGIGVAIDSLKEQDDEALTIIDTIPGGPADQAGLLPEDKIVQIENEAVKGLSVEEVIAKLKGKKNTIVHLKIIRKGIPKLLPFDITRDVVKEQNAVCFHFTDHNIYYGALNTFTHNALQQIQTLLEKSQQQHPKALILDLRYNSGGLLDAAVAIASLFLPEQSTVVVTKDRDNKVINTLTTHSNKIIKTTIPLFILVNNYTASAAEILAGCLQAHAEKNSHPDVHVHTFVVGTKTFGKGSVQELIPISNDCGLKLTTSLYCLPYDIPMQGVGVQPDFIIEQKYPPTNELKWVEEFFGHESALKNTIKVKKSQELPQQKKDTKTEIKPEDKKKSWEERKIERLSMDYQLLSTIRLIEMFVCCQKAYPQECKNRASTIALINKLFNPNGVIAMQHIALQ